MKSKINVEAVTLSIIRRIEQDFNVKAISAKIRKSIVSDKKSIQVFTYIYEFIDADKCTERNLFYVENAILSVLQLYSIHRQGMNDDESPMTTNGDLNIGSSLYLLRKHNSDTAEKRFNSLICSNSFEELIWHLRQMIKLFKSSVSKEQKINYPKLANDLYWFQYYDSDINKQKDILIKWSRNFYKKLKDPEGEENENK